MFGDRAIYHDGWIASTTPFTRPWELGAPVPQDPANDVKWELYDLTKDWTQFDDLAASNPGKLRELQELFWVEAAKYQVLPLDSSLAQRVLAPRPNLTAGRTTFTYSGELTGIPHGDAPSILNKSYTITADVEIPKGGAQGTLVTQGGRFAGFGLYLLRGKPVFVYNLFDLERGRWEGGEAVPPGKHTIVFDFTYEGGGFGKGGSGVLKVDGKSVASKRIEHTVPFIFQFDETFDIGADTGTPVDDKDYQVPFRFTGTLTKLTLELKPAPLSAADQRLVAFLGRRNNRASE